MVVQEQRAMIFLYLLARSVCILKLVLNELEVTAGVMDGELDFAGAPFISLSLAEGYFLGAAGASFGSGSSSFSFCLDLVALLFQPFELVLQFPFGAAESRAGASGLHLLAMAS